MNDLQIKLEELAGALVMADTSDPAAADELAAHLRAFADMAEASGAAAPPPCVATARASAMRLERSADQAAWNAIGRLVAALQAVIRDGRAPNTANFPPLSCDELPPASAPDAGAPQSEPQEHDKRAAPERAAMNAAPRAPACCSSGKYLAFKLAGVEYGLEILKVQEIIKMMPIVKTPHMPPFVRGVINLRDKIIPVTDLRLKFDLPAAVAGDSTCIVVVWVTRSAGKMTMGLIVDEVTEVMEVAGEQIAPPPEFGMAVDMTFILGMAKTARTVMLLLDVDRVLSAGELTTLAAG